MCLQKVLQVVLFLDDTAYHKSNALAEFPAKMNNKIKIMYFLPYVSDPNLIKWQ